MDCEHIIGIYCSNTPRVINTAFGNVELKLPEVKFFAKENQIPKNSMHVKFLFCPMCGAEID